MIWVLHHVGVTGDTFAGEGAMLLCGLTAILTMLGGTAMIILRLWPSDPDGPDINGAGLIGVWLWVTGAGFIMPGLSGAITLAICVGVPAIWMLIGDEVKRKHEHSREPRHGDLAHH